MLLPVIAAASARRTPLPGRDLRARGFVRRLFALVAATLVLVASLTAGRSYLWCAMMERAVEACCCDVEHAADEAPADERSEIRNACCEDRAFGDLDKGRVSASTPDLPDAMIAALPAPAVIVAASITAARFVPARAPSSVCASPIRAGPRTAAQTAVRLQVFRC
jgi:hypothetical protein